MAGQAGQRPVLAHARDRAVDDRRVDREHVAVADAETVGDAGTEALDDDIGLACEVEGAGPVGRVLQVEHDAALVGVEAHEQLGVPAHRVAPRRLDLDHVGADLGKELRGIGPRPPDAEVEDAQTGQKPRSALGCAAHTSLF